MFTMSSYAERKFIIFTEICTYIYIIRYNTEVHGIIGKETLDNSIFKHVHIH